jgi:hypothetical protein
MPSDTMVVLIFLVDLFLGVSHFRFEDFEARSNFYLHRLVHNGGLVVRTRVFIPHL